MPQANLISTRFPPHTPTAFNRSTAYLIFHSIIHLSIFFYPIFSPPIFQSGFTLKFTTKIVVFSIKIINKVKSSENIEFWLFKVWSFMM
jgi:hypothetical protein